MAQAAAFYTIGSMKVEKSTSYTSSDLPTTTPAIDIIKIAEAPRIWSADYNQNGNSIKKDGKTSYTKRAERGVRVTITRSGVTYTSQNVPTLYKEGESIEIHEDNTYTFYSDCIIEYGVLK